MDPTEAIAAYYRHPGVRARIAQYCGGQAGDARSFSARSLAGYGGGRALRTFEEAPVAVATAGLERLLEDGADVCRSLADRGGTLALLDVDYVNPEDPAEPYRYPERCFALLEPVRRTVSAVLLRFGVVTLVLMTGRGYHFTARAPLGSRLQGQMIAAGRLPPALRTRYEAREEEDALAVSMGAAHHGAGRLLEFLAHEVVRATRGRTGIPVTLADVPPPGRGPFICLDTSAYGDPLASRHSRCAFSTHQKASLTRVAPERPFVVALPRGESSLRDLLAARADPEAAAGMAERATIRIPDVTEAPRWVEAYRASPLARFHERFDRVRGPGPFRAAEVYDGVPPWNVPMCVAHALRFPNPALLVPTALRAVTLVLWSRGWHPRAVADLVRSRYQADEGWGDLWRRYAPEARADYYVRLFTGAVVAGLDEAADFSCLSQRERGGCPGGECGHELARLFPRPEAALAMGAAS